MKIKFFSWLFPSAGTKADSEPQPNITTSSQHSSKPHVGCSACPRNIIDGTFLFGTLMSYRKQKKIRQPHYSIDRYLNNTQEVTKCKQEAQHKSKI